jgi:ATP-dependent Lhr-like helicase
MIQFHPVVARWFSEALGTPTPAQERGWREIQAGRHTLIGAPTGSGKTLAAFLAGLNDLFEEGRRTPLRDETRIVYVSPLKALSADVHKNLAIPRRGIQQLAEQLGLDAPKITAAVRTGDTTASERAKILKTPPHILVTTPESLYLLLTSDRSREMLRTVRTVIVDEIHAVIGSRRGAHLALSLERLQALTGSTLQRIGLSATQKPIDEVGRYLVGAHGDCAIVDEGHRRAIDLRIELPGSPLEAVMAHEVWEEYYERLTALILEHKTTLVFANTRRLAERVARHLSDRLGEDAVTAHHGSLSKERRLDAEARLKNGQLRALVATASLELGIDIGHVDLVCQLGSPHRIATLLQRVGRSGHTVSGTPKGRVFPMSRDDLIESLALLRATNRGDLDRVLQQEAPLDVLAQQIVAETASREYSEEDLFALVRQAWPYRALERSAFDATVAMVAEGFSTRRGRRGALIHRDEVNRRVKARRGARLLALTSGGAIPEVADYRVVLEPGDTFIGTLNEDFAIESMAGDIFQLGNASWQVLQVGPGVMRVADAKGAPPNIPFWLGEAPARSDELSREVSELRKDIEVRLKADAPVGLAESVLSRTVDWLCKQTGADAAAAEQAVTYLANTRAMLGALPTQETLVLERFFDESGGMQLVLHAPYGSRINKAWGLALRKRFCRQFNFELQAAATDDALLLSLGPQHSFPLADVFRYLHPTTAKDVLVQALLDAPMFQTRWRWNTTVSLAVPRFRGGKKVAPQLQRMQADDLLAAAFPDAAACLENIPGDRQIPDHPLVTQTLRDCLEDAMDVDGLARVLERIHAGELQLVTRDTPEPSPICHEILNARPWAFLDDAPLEERRTQAVYARRATEPSQANEMGALDPQAIDRVRDEARPDPRDADELHDALITAGFVTVSEAASGFSRADGAINSALFDELTASRRAARAESLWIAAERLPELRAVHSDIRVDPAIDPPPTRAAKRWTREEAIAELLRGRMAVLGPATAGELAASLMISETDALAALHELEGQGAVLRGRFSTFDTAQDKLSAAALEFCDRGLLARIHRYTLNRLRAEIEPVSAADFMRFLFVWQHVDPAHRLTGLEGLRAVVARLDGFELPGRAWERAVLPARLDRYESSMLDMLCLTGQAGWGRLSAGEGQHLRVALFLREHADAWRSLRPEDAVHAGVEDRLDEDARQVLALLRASGASFLRDIARACGLTEAGAAHAIATLTMFGLVTSDGFAGVRAVIRTLKSQPVRFGRTDMTGRWSVIVPAETRRDDAIEVQARALLERYGVMFRRLLVRETNAAPWRELVRVYRRLEARGEIRGGRFVTGASGEQFALPEAVERLREVRRSEALGRNVSISAADPLNLIGMLTSGDRIRAITSTTIEYREGIPVGVRERDVRGFGSRGPSLVSLPQSQL